MNVLLSYFHHKNVTGNALGEICHKYNLNIFIDSGAFSAHKAKNQLDIFDYIRWLKTWDYPKMVYVNLDVKGSSDFTLINQRIMEDQGLFPIPVYHAGEDLSIFEKYCENYKYIALGGVAGEKIRGDSLARWLVKVFTLANEKGILLHGFGITELPLLFQFPWYSVDSVTWSQNFRWGTFYVFDKYSGKNLLFNSNDYKKFISRPYLLPRNHKVQDIFYGPRRIKRTFCSAIALNGFKTLEKYVLDLHSRNLPGYHNDFKIYHGSVNVSDITDVLDKNYLFQDGYLND